MKVLNNKTRKLNQFSKSGEKTVTTKYKNCKPKSYIIFMVHLDNTLHLITNRAVVRALTGRVQGFLGWMISITPSSEVHNWHPFQ